MVMEQLREWVVVLALFSAVGFSVAGIMLIADYADRSKGRSEEDYRKRRPAEWKTQRKKAA
jgi:hypothetical protein